MLRSPPRSTPWGLTAEIARNHGAEAYSADASRVSALPYGIAALGVLLWWAVAEGGYAPTVRYPGALAFLVLFALVVFGPARRMSRPPAVYAAIGLLGAFTAWSFLSLTWAGVGGDAWEGANRTLLYLTVFATFALLRWRAWEAAVVLGLFALGTAAIGGAVLVAEGAAAFNDNRLAAPTGYENATGALFLMGFWPAVALAARRELHWALRGLLLAAAGVLLQLALLAQSRGSVAAAAVAVLVYVLLSRQRLRALTPLLLVGAVTLASLAPLLDVLDAGGEEELAQAVSRERLALAVAAGALFALGALVGWLDRPGRARGRASLHASPRRGATTAVAVGLVLVALGAVAGASRLVETPRPGLESGRYDMWRVAAGELADHPLLGVGVDNFAVDYARERRTGEEPLYPHSLLVRAFSETGLVGGVLFLGFVGVGLAAAVPRDGRAEPLGHAAATAAVVSAVYWLVHGSIDWFWEIPALTASALALLGLAAGLAPGSTGRPFPRVRRPKVALAAAGTLFVVAVGSYALPGLAALEVERAVATWPEDPDHAYSLLDRASRLNPLSERPAVVAGTLARREGDPGRARREFRQALERAPRDWYPHLQLALLDGAAGRQAEALSHLERARELNPGEDAVAAALAALSSTASAQTFSSELDRFAVRSPIGRRPVDCRPVLGLAGRCTGEAGER